MDIEIDTENNQGDGAPLTAPKADEPQNLSIEEQGNLVVDEEQGAGEETNTEDEEGTSDEKLEGEATEENPKIRLGGAGRRRIRHFLSLGMSLKEARKKAQTPLGPKQTSKGDDIKTRANKAIIEKQGFKICIVLENFPEENLTSEQSKSVQEAIMDYILQMDNASGIKPKFNSSTYETAWLALRCTDKVTVDWVKEVVPTLKPWEGASLKALEDEEMPHPWTFVGLLPDSQEYSDEKILKLLEAQNDSLNVPSWKIVKKEVVKSQLKVIFSIDRKFTPDLKEAGYRVSYKFGHIQLRPKGKDPLLKDSQHSTAKHKGKFRGPSPYWRNDSRSRGGSRWRGQSRGGRSRPYSRSGAGRGASPWGGPPAYMNPGNMWYVDSWNPWP